jgi:hypothetical protein
VAVTSVVTDIGQAESLVGAPVVPRKVPPSPVAEAGSDVIAVLHAGWPRRLGVPLAFWTVAFFSAALAVGAAYEDLALWAALVPGVVGLLFGVTLWRRRAIIREGAVEVRSFWGTSRVRYDDVRAFTYDARSYRFYLPIPIGRVAQLALKGARGRATFHAGFARFDKYAPVIIERVVEATVQRMRSAIDLGDRARFGRKIQVDRRFVYIRRAFFRTRAVPIDDLTIEVADGDFHLSTQAKRKKIGVFPLHSVPNLLALPQLVEELSATQTRPRPTTLQETLGWNGPRS